MGPCRSHASGGAVYPAALVDGGERGRTPVNGVCRAGIYPAVICSPAIPCPVKGGGDGGDRCGPVRGGDGSGADGLSRYPERPEEGRRQDGRVSVEVLLWLYYTMYVVLSIIKF